MSFSFLLLRRSWPPPDSRLCYCVDRSSSPLSCSAVLQIPRDRQRTVRAFLFLPCVCNDHGRETAKRNGLTSNSGMKQWIMHNMQSTNLCALPSSTHNKRRKEMRRKENNILQGIRRATNHFIFPLLFTWDLTMHITRNPYAFVANLYFTDSPLIELPI